MLTINIPPSVRIPSESAAHGYGKHPNSNASTSRAADGMAVWVRCMWANTASEPCRTVLAALGPKMLALAAELTDGAHPYCVTPEHTAEARRILGPGKLLCPELMVLLETDPTKARTAARTALATYIQLANYANNWRRLGFTEDDLSGGGSNRFIDANVAWGDESAIRKRIQLFWDAGADHVCIQSIHPSGSRTTIDEQIFDLLAPSAN